jgi:hypothetical protein
LGGRAAGGQGHGHGQNHCQHRDYFFHVNTSIICFSGFCGLFLIVYRSPSGLLPDFCPYGNTEAGDLQ